MNEPPPPPWPPAPTAGYGPWPPARRRQFVWQQALLGLAAPFAAALALYVLGGFALAFYLLPLLLVVAAVVSGVRRQWTLVVSLLVGAGLMVALLLLWFVIFVLFNPGVL